MSSLLTLDMLPSTIALRPAVGDLIAGAPIDAWQLLGDGSTDIHLNAPRNPVEFAISSQSITKMFLLDGANNKLTIQGISGLGGGSGLFNVRSGDSGATAQPNWSQLVLENAGNAGSTILVDAVGALGTYAIGSTAGSADGKLQYQPSSNTMFFVAGNQEFLRADLSNFTVNNTSAAISFRVKSTSNTDALLLNPTTSTLHVGNSVTTGAVAGDLVLANNATLRFLDVGGTSSANFGVNGDVSNVLNFDVNATSSLFRFRWGGTSKLRFIQNFDGTGIVFIGMSTAAAPALGAGSGTLYTKNVAGESELFYRNNTVDHQITPAPSGIPSGTVMLFFQAAAPIGWTEVTTQNDKAVRIVSGIGGGVGGTVPFETAFASKAVTGTNTATALSIAQMAAHTHPSSAANTFQQFAAAGGGNQVANDGSATGSTGSNSTHNHTFTGTAINLDVQFINCKLASKD